jgi:GNAT superfamily N-acetyltransferase
MGHVMTGRPEIRAASAQEFAAAIDWAAAEGWNPGLGDLAAFHAADPGGFLMGFDGSEPVSSISVVRYGDDFGFLGFYIVRPDRRGEGIGFDIWNAGMTWLEGRTVGLDGVVAQQDNYRKSGFVLAGRNVRYTGVPDSGILEEPMPVGVDLIEPGTANLEAVVSYDARHFPSIRASFIRDWVGPVGGAAGRRSLVASRDGHIVGLGTIRECRAGFKVGPLFAETQEVAAGLFARLCASLSAGAVVSLDVPEDSPAAVALAVGSGLVPVFETARMYRGTYPEIPLERIFGVTTFELG